MKNFAATSYELHAEHFKSSDLKTIEKYEAWFDDSTADYWRHIRKYKFILPILKENKHSNWVTIGDGRFGLDSTRLKKLEPTLKVLPTDISPYLLKQSKERGIISDYSVENVEALSFKDNSFDFAFCKESFHHFPRAYLGLYEMLRVAKKGVILSEPNDNWCFPSVANHLVVLLKNFVKKLKVGKDFHREMDNFEPSGNYVFSLSKRDTEKVAIGLQLPTIAFKGFNDHFIKDGEKASIGSPLHKKMKRKIWIKDFFSNIGIKKHGTLITCIFKEKPSPTLEKELIKEGYEVIHLPKNPFLK